MDVRCLPKKSCCFLSPSGPPPPGCWWGGRGCVPIIDPAICNKRTCILCFRARIDKSIISFTNQMYLYWRKIMYLPVCFLQFQPCVLVWDVSLIYSSLWMFYRIMNKDMDVLLQMKKVKWKYGKYNKPVLLLNFRRICTQGCLPVCILWWTVRRWFWVNVFPHTSHS